MNLLQAHIRATITLSHDPDPLVQAQNPQIFSHTPPGGISCGVTLTPTTANVKDSHTVDFTVKVDGVQPAEGAYTYKFITPGAQGTLVSTTTSGGGTAITSTHAIIGYLAKSNASDGTTDTVSVLVYTTEKTPRLVGTAQAVITIGAAATTEPTGTLVFTKAYPNGTITVFAFYTVPLVPGANSYDLRPQFADILRKAVIDQNNPPPIDTGRTTGLASFVRYPGTNFFNLGGQLGYYVYPGGEPGELTYSPGNEQYQHDSAVLAVAPTVLVNIT